MAQWTDINAYRRRQRWPSWNKRGALRRRKPTTLADIRLIGLGGFLATLIYLQADWPLPWNANPADPALPSSDGSAGERGSVAASSDTLRARFHLCHSGGGTNCVVDGDTFWFQGQKIRIADIDTPETHPPRCAEEARLGEAATERLHGLLNAGPFSLAGGEDDRYGRALRTVTRDGASLGGVLVGEGLARWYGSGRQPWC